MNLPDDLSEGWWFVRWPDGGAGIAYLRHRSGLWWARYGDHERQIDVWAQRWTAMERVAVPSWACGE